MSNEDINKALATLVVAIFLALLVFAPTTEAGEIKLHNTDPTKFAFVGSVEEGDTERLREFLTANPQYTHMALFSGGGLVVEGIGMMELIAEHNIHTIITDGGVCYSICSFMWLGGETRIVEGEGKLGVHLPFMPHEVAAELGAEGYAEEIAKTIAWKMWKVETLGIEVDQGFWIMLMVTPSEEMYVFTREELGSLEIR